MNEILESLYNSVRERLINKTYIKLIALEKEDCTIDCSPCDNYTNILFYITYKNQDYLNEINLTFFEYKDNLKDLGRILGNDFGDDIQQIIDLFIKIEYHVKVIESRPWDLENLTIQGGIVIRNEKGQDGSLGVIGKDLVTNQFYLLSAMHVLYGDGEFDGNRNSILMKLSDDSYFPIAKNFLDRNQIDKLSEIDVAISRVNDQVLNYIKPGVLNYQNLQIGAKQLRLCRSVLRTGGYSNNEVQGYVRSNDCTISYSAIGNPYGRVRIQEAILTSGLSRKGDSGSALLGNNPDKRTNPSELLGILLGGGVNDTFSFSININVVIQYIKDCAGISLAFNF